MEEWSDRALVLRAGHFREADIWLHLLGARHGLVTAFAFGGSHSKRRFCGCLDTFNEIRIYAKSPKQFLTLQEGTLLQGPIRLRKDRNRFGMLVNCVLFLEYTGVPEENAAAIFTLFRDLLQHLEEAPETDKFIPLFFRLRFVSDLGYAPDFSTCAACGRTNLSTMQFSIAEGVPLCPACAAKQDRKGMQLSADVLHILQSVQKLSPREWNFAGEPERRTCAQLADAFVQYHLGIVQDDGKFRHQQYHQRAVPEKNFFKE